MTAPPNIALIGPMGSGKSTVAHQVAAALGWTAIDIDTEVEARAGCPISALFAAQGECAFRALEHEALADALAGHGRVIATGGGVVLDPANRDRLAERAHVLWLRASIDSQMGRLATDTQRPLLAGNDRRATLQRLAAIREPLYASIAEAVVDTDGLDPDAVAARVMATLPSMEPAAR